MAVSFIGGGNWSTLRKPPTIVVYTVPSNMHTTLLSHDQYGVKYKKKTHVREQYYYLLTEIWVVHCLMSGLKN